MVGKEFPLVLSALALFHQTYSAWHWRFSGFIPSYEPRPFALPEGLGRGGTACSPGLLASWALPPQEQIRSVSLQILPHVAFASASLQTQKRGTSGLFNPRLGFLPP